MPETESDVRCAEKADSLEEFRRQDPFMRERDAMVVVNIHANLDIIEAYVERRYGPGSDG